MKRNLTDALEAGDSERLLRLCGELDTNIALTVGGYETGQLEMPVTHHIASKACDVQFLKVLIDKLGPACLTCKDKRGNTAVHCAASYQDGSWMQLICDTLGRECFQDKSGYFERTAIHFAATNRVSNDALKWLVTELGPECLTLSDTLGDTPVHLAALYQGSDSMELANSELGVSCFYQHVLQRTAFHRAAMNKVSNDAFKWLVRVCGPECLTMKDGLGDTPVHLAAKNQFASSLQFIADQIGTEVFRVRGSKDSTVTHMAAKNTITNSALQWCIQNLGQTCLREKDSAGRTPVHLAAQHQDLDSLHLIADHLDVSAFELKDASGKTVEDCAALNSEREQMLQCIAELRLQLQEIPAQNRQRDSPFLEKWDTVQSLGSGAFGDVHEVLTDKGVKCAAKIIKLPVQFGNKKDEMEKKIKRLVDAERNLCDLDHPNIVRFLWIYQNDANIVLFMELLNGVTLDNANNGKALVEREIAGFTSQICSALSYMQSQQPPVIHRDIKGSNIMVLAGSNQIKLIDFGMSVKLQQSLSHYFSSSHMLQGTPHFLAPELLGIDNSDRVHYRPKSDIWAFGCTVYQMATGTVPHSDCMNVLALALRLQREGAPDLPDSVSTELRDFYQCCVVQDHKERKSASDLMSHPFLSNDGAAVDT